LFVTRHTLVWKDILVAVFSLSSYRYLGDGGTERREILRDDVDLTYESIVLLTELLTRGIVYRIM